MSRQRNRANRQKYAKQKSKHSPEIDAEEAQELQEEDHLVEVVHEVDSDEDVSPGDDGEADTQSVINKELRREQKRELQELMEEFSDRLRDEPGRTFDRGVGAVLRQLQRVGNILLLICRKREAKYSLTTYSLPS